MDEIVKAALKKWPNVPHCHGWLALDARGDWYMRDERIQAAGPFPRIKGSKINHAKLREFIERNYLSDDAGCWFFQNGPQRVYLQLEAAPWVWRLDETLLADGRLTSHTGATTTAGDCWLDEQDRLFVGSPLGLGIVHTLDMHWAAQAVEAGRWHPESARHAELIERFQVVLEPQP